MDRSKAHQSPDEYDSGHGGGDVADDEEDVEDVDGEGHLLPDGFARPPLEEREETPLPGEIP